MKKNRILHLFAAAAAIASLLLVTACSSAKPTIAKDKINIVTSFYPLYDFAAKIGGSRVNVINLVPAGVEPHDWAPKSGDIRTINESQLLVFEGGGFEGWIDDYLKSMPKDSKLGVVQASIGIELLVGDDNAADLHMWLSPPTAKKMAEAIKNGLVQVDPANAAEYETNFSKLASDFDALNTRYQTKLSQVRHKNIVVSHQAFGYLCREYGLTQKAIMGLAPDAEPTAKEMKGIVDYVKANDVKYIFFEELVSDKLAKTLAKDAGVETMTLNPLEGLTKEQLKAGSDYFSVMDDNLQNLVKALQ